MTILYAFCAYKSRPVWGAWIEITPPSLWRHPPPGRAPYGARGLKFYAGHTFKVVDSRAPYGARGLKSLPRSHRRRRLGSRPVWGAWIEIQVVLLLSIILMRRAPYGARGLKWCPNRARVTRCESRPVWGAWIEIFNAYFSRLFRMVAPRMGRVD